MANDLDEVKGWLAAFAGFIAVLMLMAGTYLGGAHVLAAFVPAMAATFGLFYGGFKLKGAYQ